MKPFALFGKVERVKGRSGIRPRRLGIESLERLEMLSGISFTTSPNSPDAGVLKFEGTAGADWASVGYAANGMVTASFFTAGKPGSQSLTRPASQIKSIRFTGGAGNDFFYNNTAIKSSADGGPGNDTLVGGSNGDEFWGRDGDDTLIGNGGNDRLFGEDTPSHLLPPPTGTITGDCWTGWLLGNQRPGADGKRFLLARASRGVLAERLRAAGAEVGQIVVYTSRDVCPAEPGVAEMLQSGGFDWVTVTSSAIARALHATFGSGLAFPGWPASAR